MLTVHVACCCCSSVCASKLCVGKQQQRNAPQHIEMLSAVQLQNLTAAFNLHWLASLQTDWSSDRNNQTKNQKTQKHTKLSLQSVTTKKHTTKNSLQSVTAKKHTTQHSYHSVNNQQDTTRQPASFTPQECIPHAQHQRDVWQQLSKDDSKVEEGCRLMHQTPEHHSQVDQAKPCCHVVQV